MAYPLVQGKKILIFHSTRNGKQVKQERLYAFDTFTDAKETINSKTKWSLFCASLQMHLEGKASINKNDLKVKIIKILEQTKNKDASDMLNKTTLQLISILQTYSAPLLPNKKKSLKMAKINLNLLSKAINENLILINKQKEEIMPLCLSQPKENQTVEKLFNDGLDYFDQGDWDSAKEVFLAGIKLDPDHIDLLVHAGLSELIDKNYPLALSYFNKASTIGQKYIDTEIENNPDTCIKHSCFDAWKENQVCHLAEECPDWETKKCEDCDNSPGNEYLGLYANYKFRPFFRALENKAVTLIKLKRYQKAIETLQLCQSYQPLWGTYNLIGLCHLNLGNIEEANKWVIEMLWPSAYYKKAVILFALGHLYDSVRHLLTGVTQNPHIAYMLTGNEKPEPIRYMGIGSNVKLSASEFMHEHHSIFKKYSGFTTLLRCLLNDELITTLLDELEEYNKQHKNGKTPPRDSFYKKLTTGNMVEDFLDQHVPRILSKLNNKSSAYWSPMVDEVMTVRVLTQKTQNWLVELKDFPDKTLYFRPTYSLHMKGVLEGDMTQLRVSKSWYYKKRLFVSGNIE